MSLCGFMCSISYHSFFAVRVLHWRKNQFRNMHCILTTVKYKAVSSLNLALVNDFFFF